MNGRGGAREGAAPTRAGLMPGQTRMIWSLRE